MFAKRALSVCTFVLVAVACKVGYSDDWPQWMGPQRDNIWREDGIIDRFPADGPTVTWRVPVAGGYSGPAVADGVVVVTDYQTNDNVKVANFERKQFTGVERVLCLDEQTGQKLWDHAYDVNYTMSYPAGPRCTPIIHEGKVYTLGGEGFLICFDVKTGDVIWSKDLLKEYSTKTALWGYSSHPLIDGDKLICVVGGKGSHVVAFNKNSGDELWRALTSREQGYSPPTIINAGGVRQLVLLHPQGVESVDPETGKPYWKVPYEATNGSIIMSPIQAGDLLFAAGYSNKNLLLKLSADAPKADVVWRDASKKAMSPVNVQPIRDGSVIYGFDQGGKFIAMDIETGKRLWETPQPLSDRRPVQTGTAFIVRQADRYWLFSEQGDLIIAKLSPEGYEELDRAKVIKPTNVAFGRDVVWSAPAFANQHVFIRNDEELIRVNLAK